MPRTIEVAVPTDKTNTLLEHLEGVDGVVGLAVQRNSSLDPQGDVLTIHATNEGTRNVLKILKELQVLDGGSVVTSQPRSITTRPYQDGLERESNETIWEEMAFLLRRDTNTSSNYLLLMALSGAVAAVGLWTNTLHIVIGAMVIAPGFEPLLRIPFGVVAGPRVIASRGVTSTVFGYLSLAIGAALSVLVLWLVDPSSSSELSARSWVQYWSKVTGTGVFLAFIAGAAGAVVVTAQRAVLSAGVMIALALIPSMAIAGMALVSGELALAGRGLLRWGVEAGLVVIASSLVLGLKQATIHRRRALG